MGPDARQNFDKRTLRKMYRESFVHAIDTFTADQTEATRQLDHAHNSSVQVFVRKRPIFQRETNDEEFDVLSTTVDGAYLCDCRLKANLQSGCLLPHRVPLPCFPDDCTNEKVCFAISLDKMVDTASRGGHSTCLMFGQTGSGKTYTLSHVLTLAAEAVSRQLKDGVNGIRLSCFELCGKQAYDLLDGKESIKIFETGADSIAVTAKLVAVENHLQLCNQLQIAAQHRVSSATAKNDASSRSHAFYRFSFSTESDKPGTLTLVDLAGSERNSDSFYHNALQRRQAAEINVSLSALKECIRVKSLQEPGKVVRVPYRSSPLTMLLRAALEGDAATTLTVVVATVSPCASDTEHTLNTIRNACLMAGCQMEDPHEISVPILKGEVHFEVVPHPSKWTSEEVLAWLNSVAGGRFQPAAGALPQGTTGAALMRFPESRLKLLCGGEAAAGQELYRLLRAEAQRAAESKAAGQSAMRAMNMQRGR